MPHTTPKDWRPDNPWNFRRSPEEIQQEVDRLKRIRKLYNTIAYGFLLMFALLLIIFLTVKLIDAVPSY